jgi:hypothetical protein
MAASEGFHMSPLKAVHSHCLWCCKGSAAEVRLCPSTSCPLHPVRLGCNPDRAQLREDETPVRPEERSATRRDLSNASTLALIRRRCIDCSGGSLAGARQCVLTECALHPFRMAKNPNRAGVGYGRCPEGSLPDEIDRSRPKIAEETIEPAQVGASTEERNVSGKFSVLRFVSTLRAQLNRGARAMGQRTPG